MGKITDIEGIGDSYADKLAAAGCKTTEALLKICCEKKGRTAVAEKTGISGKLLLKWTNHADLFRVKGIAGEYAELLECSGVDTVPELAQRKADNLAAKMGEVNAQKKLTRKVPTATMVADWVEQAKKLDRVVTH